MNCAEARDRLSAAVDAPVPAPVAAHLAGCAACTEHATRLVSIDARLYGLHADVRPGPAFDAELRARIAAEAHRTQAAVAPVTRRELASLRFGLRVDVWLDAAAVVATGAAGAVCIWRFAPYLERLWGVLAAVPGGAASLTAALVLGTASLCVGIVQRARG